ncbi:MAG TPA: phosphatidylglycerophosphatase A [Pirellulales bacterium]|jgi:phosphatidylglycerophosphatase A|nr:phosphatidylglycerophosphatase A [Pirellulales bacterium]
MDASMKADGRLMLVSWFGCGFIQPAPGTVTSGVIVVGYALLWLLIDATVGPVAPVEQSTALAIFSLAMFLVGTWYGPWSVEYFAANPVARSYGKSLESAQHDPSAFVLDEVAGQALALAFVPAEGIVELLVLCVAAFVFFRLFDVLKPWPIKHLERLPGGWGICADDMLAGVYAGAASWCVVDAWRALGA